MMPCYSDSCHDVAQISEKNIPMNKMLTDEIRKRFQDQPNYPMDDKIQKLFDKHSENS